MITVSELPKSAELVSNSQDIEAVFESIGNIPGLDPSDYGCLFVVVGDWDYVNVWGCFDSVPWLNAYCDPIITNGKIDPFWTD